MKKGYFITLEGPDGSGKSTVAEAVVNRLKEKGFEIVHTREPGGIDIAEQIRNVILDPKNTAMDPKTEALLYAASRRQHLVERVIPSLKDGKIVLCERFIDSSLAYQGYGRQLGFEEVLGINNFAIEGFFPDITIFLAIDEKKGLDRIKDRNFKDRLDVESQEFHHRVNEGYKKTIEHFKNRVVVVNADQDLDEVIDDVMDKIMDVING